MVGGLISAHLLATHPPTRIEGYDNKLLLLAVDLADRLLPAFKTPSKIPVRMASSNSLSQG